MDVLGMVWVPDILLWIGLVFAALYIYNSWTFSYLSSLGYTGPKPKPIIGNLDLILRTNFFTEWDLTGKKLYGKVFSMYEGASPTIVVFDTDMLKQIEVKEFPIFEDRRDLFLRGPILSKSLFDLQHHNGWRRVRTLTTPFFTTNKLKHSISHLDFCVQNLIKRCEKLAETGEEFDMKDVAGAFTLEAICLTAFGLPIDSQTHTDHPLLTAVAGVFNRFDSLTWPIWVGLLFPSLSPIFDKLGVDMWPKGTMDLLAKFTYETIQERQKSSETRPDFIQALLKAHDMQTELQESGASLDEAKKMKALSDIEIAGQGAIFLLAGYDTTSTAISFLLFNIANNPDCQERLVREINEVIANEEITYENLKKMAYLDMCLEESQRMFPPVQRVDRKCLKDTTINGYFIPKDTLVIIPVYALQNDPEFWPEPEKFNPERFSTENRGKIDPYQYQPFGQGPRQCVGMRLAQIEVKMAIIKILQNFTVKVGSKTKMPIKLKGFNTRADGGLWLQLERR